jgi:hypothetical protein
MAATIYRHRQAALGAMWWLFQGGTFAVFLANTTGANPAPAITDEMTQWNPYILSNSYTLFYTGGTATYDTTDTSKAVLPQLSIALNYTTSVTYTDLLVLVIPSKSAGTSPPAQANPFVAVIREPTAITLAANQTKTYKLDLSSQWF